MRLALHWQILIAVVAAAVLGLVLNATISTRDTRRELKDGNFLVVRDSSNRIEINIVDKQGEVVKGQSYVVDPTATTKKSYPTLSKFQEKQPKAYQLFQQYGRSTARWIGDWANNIGQLFLRMLKMVSVPLIITSLMTGVLGLSSAGRLRKLFGLTLSYYVITSMLAICTGILLVNVIQPGHRGIPVQAEVAADEVEGDLGEVLYKQVETIITANPFEAVAQGNFLSIIAFSLIFGVFTLLTGGRALEVLRDLFQAGFDVMMKMTLAIIHLAPIGVFALMLAATATQGLEVFRTLGFYLLTVFLGLLFHAVVTLPAIVAALGRQNPWQFARAMSPALMTAFSSASSNATLPLTMNCVEERAGISNRVGSFVLPLGATINMDGTALFEVVAVLFIAQMEPNINLSITKQFMVALTALLASIGAAGIPHAGLVMMVIVLQAVGLPADRVGLILAVDRLLDMCRTSVNVWSDSCGCAVVARFDNESKSTFKREEPVATAAPDGTAEAIKQMPSHIKE